MCHTVWATVWNKKERVSCCCLIIILIKTSQLAPFSSLFGRQFWKRFVRKWRFLSSSFFSIIPGHGFCLFLCFELWTNHVWTGSKDATESEKKTFLPFKKFQFKVVACFYDINCGQTMSEWDKEKGWGRANIKQGLKEAALVILWKLFCSSAFYLNL